MDFTVPNVDGQSAMRLRSDGDDWLVRRRRQRIRNLDCEGAWIVHEAETKVDAGDFGAPWPAQSGQRHLRRRSPFSKRAPGWEAQRPVHSTGARVAPRSGEGEGICDVIGGLPALVFVGVPDDGWNRVLERLRVEGDRDSEIRVIRDLHCPGLLL